MVFFQKWFRCLKRPSMLTVCLYFSLCVGIHAEVSTDGTLGPARSLSGPDYRIGAELGRSVGTNLFHSFDRFNLTSSETATFTGPDSIRSVISRVTGGSTSSIDGLLRSEIGSADFYFINPAGVVFGANARVDVPASFHVGTADEVRFGGGTIYSAVAPNASMLTAEAPESFGYLGARTGNLVINGSRLDFATGGAVTLSGGNVGISGDQDRSARVSVPDGEVRISAVGNVPDHIPFSGELYSGRGELSISNSLINLSGTGGGQLRVGSGNIFLADSSLAADNLDGTAISTGAGSGVITIRAADQLHVTNGGRITSSTFSAGGGGNVDIEAGRLHIDGEGAENTTGIAVNAARGSSGNAGRIRIHVEGALDVLNGGEISSSTFAAGNAGNIGIEAGSLLIDGQGSEQITGVFSNASPGSSGNAGMITIKTGERAAVLNGGEISSSTFSSGNAGSVEFSGSSLSLNGQGTSKFTGIASTAQEGSTGRAGSLTLRVQGALELRFGSLLSSSTLGTGDAGGVTIEADKVIINGEGAKIFTGIASRANPQSTGNAGTVRIIVNDLLEISESGGISSSTFARGNAGDVRIQTGRMRINGNGASNITGIFSNARSGSSGNGGLVTIRVSGLLEVLNGGEISSGTFALGRAGGVDIDAGSLYVDRQGANRVTEISSNAHLGSTGDAGTVFIKVSELLRVVNGGQISSSTSATGNAGGVAIDAGNMTVDGQSSNRITGISGNANFGSMGRAGTVIIQVQGLLEVINGGDISSSTFSAGDAGGVEIEAGRLKIDRQESAKFTGIASNANPGSTGDAGTVRLKVEDQLVVINGGQISSSTSSAGSAGGVEIETGSLKIDGQGTVKVTGIASNANSGSSGDAGTVRLLVHDLLEVLNGGEVSSSTFGSGNAGGVVIDGSRLLIDGRGSAYVTGIQSNAGLNSQGRAGTISIRLSDLLEVLNGGGISSSTQSLGDAGGVGIEARNMRLDRQGAAMTTGVASQAAPRSRGNAGTVRIRVADLLEVLNGAQISSSTFASGDAGGVVIEAGNLRIDRRDSSLVTGIQSTAALRSSGKGGKVTISVSDLLEVLNGGGISSSTFAEGDAGGVEVRAGELVIDGGESARQTYIASAAQAMAKGVTGNLDIEAGTLTVTNGGTISIESHPTLSASEVDGAGSAHLFIQAPQIFLSEKASITAQSTGNIPAAAITIETDALRVSGGSSITTSSKDANGGPITLQTSLIDLHDSLITSSVEGSMGNGGDISIRNHGPSKALVLEGGFIQANAPAGAQGGDIFIDTKALIPEGGALEVGGQERHRFEPGSFKNIIQAAAPGGEQGTIQITSPDLDISGSIAALEARLKNEIHLAINPCHAAASDEASSLVCGGPGGVPALPDQHATPIVDGGRLKDIFKNDISR